MPTEENGEKTTLSQNRRRTEHPFGAWARAASEHQERSFDDLAKGLVSGTISRRGALKLMGGALLGGLLVSIPRVASAQLTCTIPPDPINPCFIPCGPAQSGCGCVRTTEGGTVCAKIDRGCPDPDKPNKPPRACSSSDDCPGQQVCADVTTPLPGQTEPPGCCSRNVCVKPCR